MSKRLVRNLAIYPAAAHLQPDRFSVADSPARYIQKLKAPHGNMVETVSLPAAQNIALIMSNAHLRDIMQLLHKLLLQLLEFGKCFPHLT